MDDINYTKSIAQLYADDLSAYSATVQALDALITDNLPKLKEEKGKAYLLGARDIIMGIYVQ